MHGPINPFTAHTCALTPRSMYFYSTPLVTHDIHSPALMKASSSHTQTHPCTHSQNQLPTQRFTISLRVHPPQNTQVVIQFTCGHADMFQHMQSSMHRTHLDTRALEILHLETEGSSLPIPVLSSFGDLFSIEILVQNGSPLSMLSEGSQPYASYKNSAHVSDSGMNEMQPTRVYIAARARR